MGLLTSVVGTGRPAPWSASFGLLHIKNCNKDSVGNVWSVVEWHLGNLGMIFTSYLGEVDVTRESVELKFVPRGKDGTREFAENAPDCFAFHA